jgi:hypothetical protein
MASDDEGLDEELDSLATTEILLTFGRRVVWFFGANLAINLPFRLAFLRQAARPLGRPQHSLLTEVKSLLPSAGSESWKYTLGVSALIGLSEVATGLFSGAVSMLIDSGHIPTAAEVQEHHKPTYHGFSRHQLATLTGKLVSGVFFYPFFAVMPIFLATHRWSGLRPFLHDVFTNRNGLWKALLLNVLKYSLIDLAPWLEDKLYHHLKLIPDEDVDEESSPEEEGFFTLTHFKKYGLSLTATLLASLIYVPIDVITTQLVLNPSEHHNIVNCLRNIWRAEGWKGLYRGFWANLLSEQELLFI